MRKKQYVAKQLAAVAKCEIGDCPLFHIFARWMMIMAWMDLSGRTAPTASSVGVAVTSFSPIWQIGEKKTSESGVAPMPSANRL